MSKKSLNKQADCLWNVQYSTAQITQHLLSRFRRAACSENVKHSHSDLTIAGKIKPGGKPKKMDQIVTIAKWNTLTVLHLPFLNL